MERLDPKTRERRPWRAVAVWLGAWGCLSVVPSIASETDGGKPRPPQWEAEVKRLAQPVLDAEIAPGMAVGIWDDGRVETYGLGLLGKEITLEHLASP